MIEVEKKYRLTKTQFEKIEADLRELPVEFIAEDFEENNLYGNDDFKEKNAVLRLRKIAGKTILTFKRAISNEADVKRQIEFETAVENAGEMEKIIEAIGLEKKIVYEKRRRSWKLKNAEIALDELPFGLFMEIEGTFAAIAEAEFILEAEDFTVEHKTYPVLTLHLGKTTEENVIEARFAK